MRRAILVATVIITAVVVGTSAVAYAQQSDDKKTSPKTTSQKATSSPETTSQGATEPITTEAHAWGNYHWARTSMTNPITLQIGDNVSSVWDSHLDTTIADWNKSDPLDIARTTGGTNPKTCRATNGRIEVCNAKYGSNGWLGIASIWLSGDHITQGTTKLNDTYFNQARYNTPAWRNLVMCQEVGHDFGLGHTNEDFKNTNGGTCMDYTNDPSGKAGTNGTLSNEHPNQHDYEQLASMYNHGDPSPTIGQTSASDDNEPGNGPPAWGREKSRSADGRESIFEKDLGKGKKKLTHVLWTLEKAEKLRGGGPKEDHEHQDEDHDHQEAQPEQQQQDY